MLKDRRTKEDKMDLKTKLSTLWIFVMINMAFADIIGFMNPGTLSNIINGNLPFEITQELLLVFAVFVEIPIAMIFFSRVLKPKANKIANIFAVVSTSAFIIFGASAVLSYYFFATLEILAMLYIAFLAWKWDEKATK